MASPGLPPVLEPMLAQAGFHGMAVEVFPVLLNDFVPHNYACTMSRSLVDYAVKQERPDQDETRK